jgi:hypothetical protein
MKTCLPEQERPTEQVDCDVEIEVAHEKTYKAHWQLSCHGICMQP